MPHKGKFCPIFPPSWSKAINALHFHNSEPQSPCLAAPTFPGSKSCSPRTGGVAAAWPDLPAPWRPGLNTAFSTHIYCILQFGYPLKAALTPKCTGFISIIICLLNSTECQPSSYSRHFLCWGYFLPCISSQICTKPLVKQSPFFPQPQPWCLALLRISAARVMLKNSHSSGVESRVFEKLQTDSWCIGVCCFLPRKLRDERLQKYLKHSGERREEAKNQ